LKCEAYIHVFTTYKLKIRRNIRMQRHSSKVFLKIERLSWVYMHLQITVDLAGNTLYYSKKHGNYKK
jgi:hypothetical protein